MTGRKNRIARLFNQSTKRTLLLAVDHGMALGPMKGIEDVNKTVKSFSQWIDSILITKGMLMNSYAPDGKTGIIIRGTGGATIIGEDLRNEQLITTPEESIFLGADAMAIGVSIGSPYEGNTIKNLSIVSAECKKWGIPVLGIVTVGKDKERQFDLKYLKLCTRVLVEHGADIIKTYYTADGFEEITKNCPVPVLIAGGPKCETELDVLHMVYGAIQSGAAGIAMGRNLWQSSNPIGMIQAVYNIIHKDASVEQVQSLILE